MIFSEIFHPECDPIGSDDAPYHVVFSCLQWKNASLEVMPRAAKQTFAVIYSDTVNYHVTATLERAYVIGAMSAVRLIAVHQDTLHLFLDSGISSTTLQEIEALWTQVIFMSSIHLVVNFACVNEVYSGCSDYIYWQAAKHIMEYYTLGIEQYDLFVLDDFSVKEFVDKEFWPVCHVQYCPILMPSFANTLGYSKKFISLYYIHPLYRKRDAQYSSSNGH